jgi:nucleoside-diphosphate-sugar epimerase
MYILVTGENGYLARPIIEQLQHGNHIIEYREDVRKHKQFNQIDLIIHLASPSDRRGFENKHKTITTIINGTINMVELANKHKAKLIFASTMGVHTFNIDDEYCSCKRAMEHYIKVCCKRYLILRIPRVYSSCRSKGLIASLKENDVPDSDLDKSLEYIDLSEFIEQFKNILHLNNITYEFNNLTQNTISEIRSIYI